MKSAITLFVGFVISFTLRADVYQESKTIAGTMKSWTAAAKQRTEIPNPMTGSPMIHIIRVDNGVQWKLDAVQKVYEEEPIALPFDASKNLFASKDLSTDAQRVEVKKRAEKKKIGDFDAEGYDMTSSNHTMTFWMAPLSGDMAKANEELHAFHGAYSKKMYENFPAKERTTIEEASKSFSGAITSQFGSLVEGFKKLPKGLMVGLEGSTPEMSGMGMPSGMMLFQLMKIQTSAADDAKFELPSGFQKVPSLMEYQSKHMMNQMKNGDMSQMQEMMKRMQEMQKNQGDSKGSMPSEKDMEEMMKKMPANLGE